MWSWGNLQTKGDTFLKGLYQMFMFKGRLPAIAILGIVFGLVLVTWESSSLLQTFHRFRS